MIIAFESLMFVSFLGAMGRQDVLDCGSLAWPTHEATELVTLLGGAAETSIVRLTAISGNVG
jgi:hypothetical protein